MKNVSTPYCIVKKIQTTGWEVYKPYKPRRKKSEDPMVKYANILTTHISKEETQMTHKPIRRSSNMIVTIESKFR